MKLKHFAVAALTAAVLVLPPLDAGAALRADDDRLARDQRCHLPPAEAAAVETRTAELLRRLQMAAAEAVDHPDFYLKVEGQIRATLAEMRATYGAQCVISLDLR